MDGFCLQGELDLTLFYKIEGHLRDTLRDILKTEILNDLNDRDLNDRKSLMTLNDTCGNQYRCPSLSGSLPSFLAWLIRDFAWLIYIVPTDST